jgi:hypothetical protein
MERGSYSSDLLRRSAVQLSKLSTDQEGLCCSNGATRAPRRYF